MSAIMAARMDWNRPAVHPMQHPTAVRGLPEQGSILARRGQTAPFSQRCRVRCRPGGAAPAPTERLDFELPFGAKFLLLAAYVASRNRPALDRRLFDPTARSGRRRGAMASDKQVLLHVACGDPLHRCSTCHAGRARSMQGVACPALRTSDLLVQHGRAC